MEDPERLKRRNGVEDGRVENRHAQSDRPRLALFMYAVMRFARLSRETRGLV